GLVEAERGEERKCLIERAGLPDQVFSARPAGPEEAAGDPALDGQDVLHAGARAEGGFALGQDVRVRGALRESRGSGHEQSAERRTDEPLGGHGRLLPIASSGDTHGPAAGYAGGGGVRASG